MCDKDCQAEHGKLPSCTCAAGFRDGPNRHALGCPRYGHTVPPIIHFRGY